MEAVISGDHSSWSGKKVGFELDLLEGAG